jgi:hypothetical protein
MLMENDDSTTTFKKLFNIFLSDKRRTGILHFAAGFVLGSFLGTGFGDLFGCVCKRLSSVAKVI